ncbi:FAD-dependent oxidoreductase [Pedobacter paludis]|uniref:Flavin-dependent monooxygenase n=1 Tax=Pedobacter paludis TaxID=2203212 RepID=A0A317EZN8_9SPHI|nr:NAD(P)/FAD-dependent oxidoreductase [Pedobacter paludis]PWS31975.1 tetracycline resistance protein [Pedobacter paludis]
MMLLENKTVAIIGGGPVGLTMARLLQQKGVSVNVYERDKNAEARISGGTLDLHKGSGQDALEKAGLLETYYAMAKPMGRTIADEQGNVLLSKKSAPESQFDNPEINRNDLKRLLLESLASETVVWDRKFTGLEERDGKWLLHFENNESATADFVIGANGGMSAVRKYVTDAQVEYTGTIMVQGDVAQPEINCKDFYQRCDDNILMVASNGNLLVANPKNGDLLSYNVIFKKPEEWESVNELNKINTAGIASFLKEKLSSWGECYQKLFGATSSFVIWTTRKIPLDKPWNNDRTLPITLIGDAAHIMPPFAGQGVNIGLKDALILSENLTNGAFETIDAAIKDYEQKMFVYAREAEYETNKNEIEMLNPNFSFLKFNS